MTRVYMRIHHLKGIKEKWTAQLRQLPPSGDQRLHLAEALQDLDTLIQRLDDSRPGDEPHLGVTAASQVSMGV